MEYAKCKEAADYILEQTPIRPVLGVICGSGLANLGDLLESTHEILYSQIPHFAMSTAPGHGSRMLLGYLDGVQVVLMQGRFHLYEGYTIHQCAMHVRVLRLLGIEGLVITNAAGGLNPGFNEGDIMILEDHINLMSFVGINPLTGANEERFGPRFFALDQVYDFEWRRIAKETALEMGLENRVKEGVYTMLGGPNFETPAELRMLKMCGVDAVGMSTVHEATTAKHCGLRVFAFSLITNVCVIQPGPTQTREEGGDLAQEVFGVTRGAAPVVQAFVRRLIPAFSKK